MLMEMRRHIVLVDACIFVAIQDNCHHKKIVASNVVTVTTTTIIVRDVVVAVP
jgi:hypothetical protein